MSKTAELPQLGLTVTALEEENMLVFDDTGDEAWGTEAEVSLEKVVAIMGKLFDFLKINKPESKSILSFFNKGIEVQNTSRWNCIFSGSGLSVRVLYSTTVDFSLRIYFPNEASANNFVDFLAEE